MYQIYKIKEFVQPKIEPQQGISYLERAREGDGRVGQQAVKLKVRLGQDYL